ncbi:MULTISPECIES: NAD+ synthase [Chromohalobacter]|uniref:Glutamine-dependent NAD(+) synthetase n=1 Tax=Chromohalobacter moromii TaxID=2860329 RepID=A0A9X2X4D7_9GAMM|nr:MULTISPECIES: NAD+ synthase [Chromohalobacter]MCK2047261.1 NAD+ synthase [Chromohalobacter moromii]MCT8470092.1 NAD+ synthase [Chromohalobacter canadensis]MCT8473147.1 NAD+ synthase [Chromohalobacter canadensis]MCT8500519.1 NAD+ synthase [Chromohalobacter canadensis]MCT8506839.1 NAD+ synthase [Chromohalobacter moromii]
MQDLTLVMAQLDPLVGDIPGNTAQAIEAVREARIEHRADVVVFPELFLTGYPPEDLLLRESMETRLEEARATMARKVSRDVMVVIGYPGRRDGRLHNLAGVLYNGEWLGEYAKQALPNYQVFDEQRYFTPGHSPLVIEHGGAKLGILICEDLWDGAPVTQSVEAGADILVTLNASPYHRDKPLERERLFARRAQAAARPLVYLNQIGGQDELVFDGGSLVLDAQGEVAVRAPFWEVGLMPVRFTDAQGAWAPEAGECEPLLASEESLYCALVTGLRDYVNKSGFQGVVLGLSGGIDSALSLAIAVDALGPERVQAVMMPYHYTADISKADAAAQADLLGVHYEVMPIAPMVEAFTATLEESFAGTQRDTTEENLQSRCRGVLLMALSNKKGLMVLSTGNKSEMAVGYATLYGDMVGGYNALKDVYKTWVYRLAKWRNAQEPAIPERVITRPPSAELAPDQADSDSLPGYDELDAILERYIEGDMSAEAIIDAGFASEDVYKVVKLVDRSEYKRRQAPVGVRVTARGFGRDRRYPIVNGWQPGE